MGWVSRLAACAAALLAPWASSAQDGGDWKFQGTVYLYLPSVDGKTTFPSSGGGSSVGVDAGSILDHLKMTFMGSLEASRGPWGVYTDAIYIDLGDSASGSRAITIGGGLPAGASASIDYDLRGWLWTLAGTWRAVSTPSYRLDVVGGTRLLDMKQTVDWRLAGNIGSIPLPDQQGVRTTSLVNWDAIVGVKGRAAFGDGLRWFVPYYLDIGAGESKFTWQAIAGVGYSFGWGDVVGVWRYIDYRMKSGSVIESLSFNGPGVAAVFRW